MRVKPNNATCKFRFVSKLGNILGLSSLEGSNTDKPTASATKEGTDSGPKGQTPEPRDRNVYILGAGFSSPAGAPLINEFLGRSRAFLDQPMGSVGQANREQRAPFEAVFAYKREMSPTRAKVRLDLDNIEELFGLVEISYRLNESQQHLRDSMALMISRTLEWATEDESCRPQVRIGPFGDGGGGFATRGFRKIHSMWTPERQAIITSTWIFTHTLQPSPRASSTIRGNGSSVGIPL